MSIMYIRWVLWRSCIKWVGLRRPDCGDKKWKSGFAIHSRPESNPRDLFLSAEAIFYYISNKLDRSQGSFSSSFQMAIEQKDKLADYSVRT